MTVARHLPSRMLLSSPADNIPFAKPLSLWASADAAAATPAAVAPAAPAAAAASAADSSAFSSSFFGRGTKRIGCVSTTRWLTFESMPPLWLL